jgi:hypothetical protein
VGTENFVVGAMESLPDTQVVLEYGCVIVTASNAYSLPALVLPKARPSFHSAQTIASPLSFGS